MSKTRITPAVTGRNLRQRQTTKPKPKAAKKKIPTPTSQRRTSRPSRRNLNSQPEESAADLSNQDPPVPVEDNIIEEESAVVAEESDQDQTELESESEHMAEDSGEEDSEELEGDESSDFDLDGVLDFSQPKKKKNLPITTLMVQMVKIQRQLLARVGEDKFIEHVTPCITKAVKMDTSDKHPKKTVSTVIANHIKEKQNLTTVKQTDIASFFGGEVVIVDSTPKQPPPADQVELQRKLYSLKKETKHTMTQIAAKQQKEMEAEKTGFQRKFEALSSNAKTFMQYLTEKAIPAYQVEKNKAAMIGTGIISMPMPVYDSKEGYSQLVRSLNAPGTSLALMKNNPRDDHQLLQGMACFASEEKLYANDNLLTQEQVLDNLKIGDQEAINNQELAEQEQLEQAVKVIEVLHAFQQKGKQNDDASKIANLRGFLVTYRKWKLFYDKAKREYQGSDKRQPVGTANAQLRSLLWPDNAENVQPNIKLTEAEKKKMYNSITNSVQKGAVLTKIIDIVGWEPDECCYFAKECSGLSVFTEKTGEELKEQAYNYLSQWLASEYPSERFQDVQDLPQDPFPQSVVEEQASL